MPAPRGGWSGRSLAHRDDDGVAAEAEHQPRPLRLQVQDHARLVLQPEIAAARRADRKAVAGLAIGAGELPELAEVVHLARRLDGGEVEAADPDPADLKRILHAANGQDAGARAAAADVGRLHLVHLDGPVRRLALDRLRSERDAPDAPSKIQHALMSAPRAMICCTVCLVIGPLPLCPAWASAPHRHTDDYGSQLLSARMRALLLATSAGQRARLMLP